jgi:hypothetical protein
MKVIFALVLVSLMCSISNAGLLYVYSRLATKDLDQVNKIVQDKIQESRKSSGDKTIPLKEALQAVFSRPNEDFMIEKVMPTLKAELEEHNGWERTIKALVKEALGALGNPKAFHPNAQVTYIVFLENLISEFRPKAYEPFEKSILEQIKDADIEVTKEAKNERRLRMMKDTTSPSKLAEFILANPPKPPTTVPVDGTAAMAGTMATSTTVEQK